MFGKKKRLIETQAALIADLREENYKLTCINNGLRKENARLSNVIVAIQTSKLGINIDFPNSQKGGSDHTGAVNVSDILQH